MMRWRVTVRENNERGRVLMHNTADNRIGVVDLLFNWMRVHQADRISIALEPYDVR